jgi:hypothetical protein
MRTTARLETRRAGRDQQPTNCQSGVCWLLSRPAFRVPRLALGALALVLLSVAGHVLAAGDETGDDRAQQLQRDQQMLQTLVDSGLKLAAETDPLRRADHCNRLADRLGKEIKLAVQKKDVRRATLFGEQVQALLTRGVAGNLTVARASLLPDPGREPEIARLGVEVSVTAKLIEDAISNQPELEPENMLLTLQAVAKGKAEVDIAVKGKK